MKAISQPIVWGDSLRSLSKMSQWHSGKRLCVIAICVILCGWVNGYEYGEGSAYNQQLSDDRLCSSGVNCSPLNSCPLVRDLMHRSCFSTEKLRDFTCGYRGSEPMVCCPPGGEQSPVSASKPTYFRPFDDKPYHLNQQRPADQGCNPVESVDPAAYSTHRPIMDSASTSSGTGLNVNCGQSLVRDTKQSGLGAHPWVVRVGFLNIKTRKTSHVCLGSIIAPNVILTSAYCANASDDVNFLSSVRVGEFDYKTDPDCNDAFCANPVQAYAIDRAILHPDYDAKTYKHNVALLMLNKTIQYNLAAQPICVLSNGQVPLLGRRGHLIGWGKSTNNMGQEISPSQQQQIELPIVPLEDCRKVYEQKVPITREHLCVGGEGKRDACSGFTGAPLVLLEHHTFSRYYQVAIMSFGSDRCGKDGTPSVYTSVHNYYDWINLNMK